MRYFLISIDTLRADVTEDIGMDDLFDHYCRNYFTSSNWTLPAHAALLTGHTLHGCHWDWELPETDDVADQIMEQKKGALRGRTIAQEMQHYGYNTMAMVGGGFVSKWFGFDLGFDDWKQEDAFPLATISEIDFPDNSFIFIHDYFVHNYFVDCHWPILKLRAREFMNPEGMDKKMIAQAWDAYINRIREETIRLTKLVRKYPNDKIIVIGDHGEAFVERPRQIHHGAYADLKYPEVARVPLGIRNMDIDTNQILFDIDIKDMILYGTVSKNRVLKGRYSYWGKHYNYVRKDGAFTRSM